MVKDTINFAVLMLRSINISELINKTLMYFTTEPLIYDLCEIIGEEEIVEMSRVCEEIRNGGGMSGISCNG